MTRYPPLDDLVAMIAAAVHPKRSKRDARKLIHLAIAYARKTGELPPDPHFKRPDLLIAWARARPKWSILRDLPDFPRVETGTVRIGITIQRGWDSVRDELRAAVEIPTKRADLEAAYRTAEAERRILLDQLADAARELHAIEEKRRKRSRESSEYAKRPRDR